MGIRREMQARAPQQRKGGARGMGRKSIILSDMRIAKMLRNRPMAKIGPKLPGRRAAGFTLDQPDSTHFEPSGRQERAKRSQRRSAANLLASKE